MAMNLPSTHPLHQAGTASSPLIQAYRGVRPDRQPVWFMRQAGRSLPEYRSIRATSTMLDACLTPDLAAEITLQPVRRHKVDAAIFFSDIVLPLKVAGIDVDIKPGVGPVMGRAVRTAADVAALPELDPKDLAPIAEAIGICVAELGATPLIGFAGAPFTVASYLVEGGPSRDHLFTRALMHADPAAFAQLLAWVARTTTTFLQVQIEAGASAVQLFDSWAGMLNPDDYRGHVMQHSASVFAAVAHYGVPRVHFGTKTGEILPDLKACGADVIGVDDRISMSTALDRLGDDVVVQGNIDPARLFTPFDTLTAHIDEVRTAGLRARAHVMNLGHGVPPNTDPDVLTRAVAYIHGETV